MRILLSILLLLFISTASAQSVLVTMKVDQLQILTGAITTLHVYGQISPNVQAQADRIFSWHLDLLNLNGSIARPDYSALKRPASDNDPSTSSSGSTVGTDQIGIYDTFLKLAAAGKNAPVELFSVPIKGLVSGHATFRVRAGTGSTLLSSDFLVARSDAGDPFSGGDYLSATIDLEIVEPAATSCQPTLAVKFLSSAPAQRSVVISFDLCPGANHVVEFTPAIGPAWQPLPGAPHNSGSVTNQLSGAAQFYRVRISGE
jgi:hypothetical protein